MDLVKGGRATGLAAAILLVGVLRADAAKLPEWDITGICAKEGAAGQCTILELQARRTLSGGWPVLPDAYRQACLDQVREPDVSYRLLSQCIEVEVMKARQLAEAKKAGDAAAAAQAVAAASAEPTTLEAYLARRESWGMGPEPRTISAPLAAGAVSPLPQTSAAPAVAAAGEPIMHPLEERPIPQVGDIPKSQIDKALADLLAERESWGTAPGSTGSAATPPAETTAASTEPTTLEAYLARRESWGTGPVPRTINAPLAAGAVSPLPQTSVAAPAVAAGEPIMHPLEDRPIPQVGDIPKGQIDKALADLLAERESWGTAPGSTGSAATPPAETTAASAEPTTLEAYLARRESWGTGPEPRTISAPLAAGAVSPLPQASAAPAVAAGEPIMHPLEDRPIPQVGDIPKGQIDKALADLLAERESWGTNPAQSGLTPAARVDETAAQSAAAADCEAKLRAATKRTIGFQTNSADLVTGASAILDDLAAAAKGCSGVAIRVEGHTDSIGGDAFNLALSERRARAVVDYLIAAGVDAGSLEAKGFGEARPLVPNTSIANRARNRRIEFTVR